jgi:anti-sigma B factor antagonist
MAAPEFRITVAADGSRRSIVLGGELDLVSAAELEATATRLCVGEVDELVIDMRGLTFIDSTGLRAILTCWEVSKGRCRLRLIPGPPAVQRVFEVTGLLDRLPFDADS